jgi:hypothetical protein
MELNLNQNLMSISRVIKVGVEYLFHLFISISNQVASFSENLKKDEVLGSCFLTEVSSCGNFFLFD